MHGFPRFTKWKVWSFPTLENQTTTASGMNSGHVYSQQWNSSDPPRAMTDRIHSEVKSMVANSRLKRQSHGIALVHRRELQIGELLGHGAFSEVHEVCVVNNPGCISQRRYAMKHLKAKLLAQPENFRLAAVELAVEAHMLASFDHPNIMKIRGWAANGVASFTTGRHDSFFLLLDCLDETLDQRIAAWQRVAETGNYASAQGIAGNLVSGLWKRFSHGSGGPVIYQNSLLDANNRAYNALHLEKLGICVEIAAGLAYLHNKGVIFRDLKPNNIGFLNGHVQLFDFGLSRELPSLNLDEPFEMSGKVGTLRYMAPEIASHQSYNVSADVYSWAMVCYEIFMLEKPFHGWTRDMHSSLVCGRGARPDVSMLSNPVRTMLEICWSQCSFHRPSMKDVEQRMKMLEEQQLMSICGNEANNISLELPKDFECGVRKMPQRNVSESQTATTTSLSTESLASFMYP